MTTQPDPNQEPLFHSIFDVDLTPQPAPDFVNFQGSYPGSEQLAMRGQPSPVMPVGTQAPDFEDDPNAYGPGYISWLFRALDSPGQIIRRGIHGVLSGDPLDGFEALWDAHNIFDPITQSEYVSFRDIMDDLGIGKDAGKIDLPILGKTDLANFIGEVLLDPLTYLSGGSTAAGKMAAGKAAKIVSEGLSGMVQKAGRVLTKTGGRTMRAADKVLPDSVSRAWRMFEELGEEGVKKFSTHLDEVYRAKVNPIGDLPNTFLGSAVKTLADADKILPNIADDVAESIAKIASHMDVNDLNKSGLFKPEEIGNWLRKLGDEMPPELLAARQAGIYDRALGGISSYEKRAAGLVGPQWDFGPVKFLAGMTTKPAEMAASLAQRLGIAPELMAKIPAARRELLAKLSGTATDPLTSWVSRKWGKILDTDKMMDARRYMEGMFRSAANVPGVRNSLRAMKGMRQKFGQQSMRAVHALKNKLYRNAGKAASEITPDVIMRYANDLSVTRPPRNLGSMPNHKLYPLRHNPEALYRQARLDRLDAMLGKETNDVIKQTLSDPSVQDAVLESTSDLITASRQIDNMAVENWVEMSGMPPEYIQSIRDGIAAANPGKSKKTLDRIFHRRMRDEGREAMVKTPYPIDPSIRTEQYISRELGSAIAGEQDAVRQIMDNISTADTIDEAYMRQLVTQQSDKLTQEFEQRAAKDLAPGGIAPKAPADFEVGGKLVSDMALDDMDSAMNTFQFNDNLPMATKMDEWIKFKRTIKANAYLGMPDPISNMLRQVDDRVSTPGRHSANYGELMRLGGELFEATGDIEIPFTFMIDNMKHMPTLDMADEALTEGIASLGLNSRLHPEIKDSFRRITGLDLDSVMDDISARVDYDALDDFERLVAPSEPPTFRAVRKQLEDAVGGTAERYRNVYEDHITDKLRASMDSPEFSDLLADAHTKAYADVPLSPQFLKQLGRTEGGVELLREFSNPIRRFASETGEPYRISEMSDKMKEQIRYAADYNVIDEPIVSSIDITRMHRAARDTSYSYTFDGIEEVASDIGMSMRETQDLIADITRIGDDSQIIANLPVSPQHIEFIHRLENVIGPVEMGVNSSPIKQRLMAQVTAAAEETAASMGIPNANTIAHMQSVINGDKAARRILNQPQINSAVENAIRNFSKTEMDHIVSVVSAKKSGPPIRGVTDPRLNQLSMRRLSKGDPDFQWLTMPGDDTPLPRRTVHTPDIEFTVPEGFETEVQSMMSRMYVAEKLAPAVPVAEIAQELRNPQDALDFAISKLNRVASDPANISMYDDAGIFALAEQSVRGDGIAIHNAYTDTLQNIWGKHADYAPTNWRAVDVKAFDPNVKFPGEVAAAIEATYKTMTPDNLNKFNQTMGQLKRGISSANKTARFLTTKIFPGYWGRNLLTGYWQQFIGNAFGVSSNIHAARIATGARKYVNALADLRSGIPESLDSARKIVDDMTSHTVKLGDGTRLSYADIIDEANANGVLGTGKFAGGFGSTDQVEELFSAMYNDKKGGMARQVKEWMGEHIGKPMYGTEDYPRLGHYLERRVRGDTPLEAADAMRIYQFDFEDVGAFDEAIEPFLWFWRWTRKNLGHSAWLALNNPGVFTTIARLYVNAEREKTPLTPDQTPKWMRKAGFRVADNGDFVINGKKAGPQYLPIEFVIPQSEIISIATEMFPEGTPKTLAEAIPAPFEAAARVGGDLMFSRLMPFLKVPIEMAKNQSFFKDRPIQQYEGEVVDYGPFEVSPGTDHMLRSLRPINAFINAMTYDKGVRNELTKSILPMRRQKINIISQTKSQLYQLASMKSRATYGYKKALKSGDERMIARAAEAVKDYENRIKLLRKKLAEVEKAPE